MIIRVTYESAMQLKLGETLLRQRGFDNYRLLFVRERSGDYSLIVFMKVQFFFKDGPKLRWTGGLEAAFVSDWRASIRKKWGGRVVKSLRAGRKVRIDFRFQTQVGGFMWDHWEITVTRIPRGAFRQSWVRDGHLSRNTSALDSEDLVLTSKGHGQKQRGAVHEFGHMLGLDDEYTKGHKHAGDYRSIMHSGEAILPRHNSSLLKWLEKALKDEGIN